MSTRSALSVAAILVLCGCAENKAPAPAPSVSVSVSVSPSASAREAPTTTMSGTSHGAWAGVVSGVRARLLATPAADAGGRRLLRLELEVENISDSADPIQIWWSNDLGSMLKLTLEDEAGTAQPTSPVAGSFASGPPHWLALPVSTTMRTVLSPTTIEYTRPDQPQLRPFTFQAWPLPDPKKGKMYFRGTLTPPPPPADANRRAWTGHFDLPRVALP